jgi:NHLM bacteriocin system ABC transporter ATP-binding protein
MTTPHDIAASRFALDAPQTLWRVTHGEVHVFLARLGEAGAGSRHHLWTAGPGDCLFGCAPIEDHVFLATATLGSRVEREVIDAPSSLERLDDALQPLAVERWLAGLLRGMADMVRPHPIATAELGALSRMTVAAHQPLRGMGPLTWVSGLGDAGLYLGTEPVGASALVPLTPDSWVVTLDNLEAVGLSTAEALAGRSAWPLLRETHELLLRTAITNARLADVDTFDRLRYRVTSSSQRRRDALQQLLSALHNEPIPQAEPAADPWLMACRVLGRELGVTFGAPPKDLPRDAPVREQIRRMARTAGVRWRVVTLPPQWWTRDLGPLLVVRTADGAPCAALPDRGRYTLQASLSAPAKRLEASDAAAYAGDAIMFYRPFPAELHSLRALASFALRGCRPDALRMVLTVMGLGLAATATPLSLGLFASWVLPTGQSAGLWGILMGLIAFAVASACMQVLQGLTWLRLEGRTEGSASAALMDRVLRLPTGFFQQFGSGDLGQRILSLSTLRATVGAIVIGSLAPALIGLFSIVLLAFIDWHFAVAALCLALVALGVAVTLSSRQAVPQSTADAMAGRNANLLNDVITGIQKLRVTATEDLFLARWAKQFNAQRLAQSRADRLSDLYDAFGVAFPLFALAIACGVGYAIPDSAAGHGRLIAGQIALLQVAIASHALGSALMALRRTRPLQAKIVPLLEATAETRLRGEDPGVLSGAVRMTQVSFAYGPDLPPILRDFSLDINAGEFVALVGPSGCGKSTVLRLLMGFETPERGTIEWDGRDIIRLDIEAVRRQVGTVLQSGKLLPGTIRQFIAGTNDLTDDEIWAALGKARLDDVIGRLPMGLHTGLGDSGGGFSGGQRQRLLLAKAMATQPRILILDEATSALDNQTQAEVMQTLRQLNCTRIVVAHRLSTIRQADRIVTLVDGQVAQTGTYDELVQQPGPFQDLVRRQQLD